MLIRGCFLQSISQKENEWCSFIILHCIDRMSLNKKDINK